MSPAGFSLETYDPSPPYPPPPASGVYDRQFSTRASQTATATRNTPMRTVNASCPVIPEPPEDWRRPDASCPLTSMSVAEDWKVMKGSGCAPAPDQRGVTVTDRVPSLSGGHAHRSVPGVARRRPLLFEFGVRV